MLLLVAPSFYITGAKAHSSALLWVGWKRHNTKIVNFLNNIKSRLQKPKSSADVLGIVDDLDDESKKFYKQIKKGEKRDLTKNENRYYTSLVDARNSLKEKLGLLPSEFDVVEWHEK